MRDFPCDHIDCAERSVPISGNCGICRRHLCLEHSKKDVHACSKLDSAAKSNQRKAAQIAELQHVRDLLHQIDLSSIAESLRPSHNLSSPIVYDTEDDSLRGDINVHMPVDFDDGVRWIIRARQTGYYASPPHISRTSMKGEMDKLRWLESVGVPAPKVKSDIYTNGGTDLYFLERLPGRACQAPIMHGAAKEATSRTIADLAKALVLISNHPFQLHGSIVHQPVNGQWIVGPLLSHSTIDVLHQPHHPGPFTTAAQKDAGKMRIAAILTFSWLRDTVGAFEPFNRVEQTYVMHTDATGSHIMVDEEDGITGIIDWEWAAAGHKLEAFAAPAAIIDYMSLTEATNELSLGESQLFDEFNKLGRSDLADCVRGGKVYQRLRFITQPGDLWICYPLIMGLAESMGVEVPGDRDDFLSAQKAKYQDAIQ